MQYIYYKPKGILSEYVKLIWILDDSACSASDSCYKLMPSGCIDMLFHFGDRPYDKTKNGKEKQSHGVIIGQKSKYSEYISSGKTGIISAMLNPENANVIMNLPLNLLSNQHIDAVDIFGKAGMELIEKINVAYSHEERIKLIENFLKERIIKNLALADKQIQESVRQINNSGGTVRIKNLADKINISKRQLERKFSEKVGLSPKEFSKIIRYQNVLAIKHNNNLINFTTLGYQAGYSDQAHFVNDFKLITGYTPKEYFNLIPAFSDYYTFL